MTNTRIISCFSVVFLLVLIHVYLFMPQFQTNFLGTEQAAQFGDFIGGYIGTVVSIVTLFVVLITYINSREEAQQKSFEDKFFQLLGLFDSSVSNTVAGVYAGKRSYTLIYNKWRKIYLFVEKVNKDKNLELSDEEVFQISYFLHYYGMNFLQHASEEYLARIDRKKINELRRAVIAFRRKEKEAPQQEGHLGKDSLFSGSQTALSSFYAKTVRSCLTPQQQALLAMNIHSGFGRDWIKEGLLDSYNPIKNIPRNYLLRPLGKDLKTLFPDLKFDFEDAQVS